MAFKDLRKDNNDAKRINVVVKPELLKSYQNLIAFQFAITALFCKITA